MKIREEAMFLRFSLVIILTVAVLSGGPSTLSADPIIYVDQTRTTSAIAFVEDAPDIVFEANDDTAPDFGPFESLVQANALLPLTFAHADASQNSILTDELIFASGAANTAAAIDPLDMVSAASTAMTLLDVTFQLEKTFDYQLFSQIGLTSEGVASSSVLVLLEGPGGVVFSDLLSDVNDVSAQFQEGTLGPGLYSFTAVTEIDSNTVGKGRGSFIVGLIIPEPATATLLTLGALFIIPRRRRRHSVSTQ
ncbi:MAG: hypothetical protein V3W34_16335 [Phycisphaerae bacterium]